MAAKKGYNTEAIIRKLRQAEVMLHEGKSIAEACRSLRGMQVSQAKRLKELEQENTRLKKAVANLTVDKLILQEVVQGK